MELFQHPIKPFKAGASLLKDLFYAIPVCPLRILSYPLPYRFKVFQQSEGLLARLVRLFVRERFP
jgi:hypothetical protein